MRTLVGHPTHPLNGNMQVPISHLHLWIFWGTSSGSKEPIVPRPLPEVCIIVSCTELILLWQTLPFTDLPQCRCLQFVFPFSEHLNPVCTLPQVIYTLRDPRDVVVSYFYFCQMCNSYEDPVSFEQFLRDFLNGECECGLCSLRACWGFLITSISLQSFCMIHWWCLWNRTSSMRGVKCLARHKKAHKFDF